MTKTKKSDKIIRSSDVNKLLNICLSTIANEIDKITTASTSSEEALDPQHSIALEKYTKLLLGASKDVRESITSGTYNFSEMSLDELKALAGKVGLEVPKELTFDETDNTYKLLESKNKQNDK